MTEPNAVKTVLLVEDEALIALNEASILQRYGYDVVTVTSGEKAVEAVRSSNVDIVLMDIDLGKGKMDGTEAAEALLHESELPIVFLTSHGEKEMVEKVKGITRYGYVLKNAGEFVLIESINMAFELFQSHIELKKRNIFIETTLDNLPIGLAVNYIDEGTATYLNKQFVSIYGWPKEELTDISNFFTCVYPDPEYREQLQHRVMSDIESGDPERMEWDDIEATTKEGKKKIIRAKNIPIIEQNFMISTVQDVTDQKLAQKALRESESKYRQLLDNAGMGIGLWDREGRLLMFNKTAAEWMGGKPEEFEGKWIRELFPPEKAELYLERIQKTIRRGSSLQFESDYVRLEGRTGWFSSTYNCVYAETGEIVGVEIVSSDITGIKQAEENYRNLYEQAPMPYQSLDEEGNIIDVNPAWLTSLGYRRDEVIGKNFSEFLHPDWKELFEVNFPAFKKRGSVHEVQFKIQHKNGNYRDVSFEGSIGYNSDGSFRQTYCVFKDITESKAKEEKLQYMNALFSAQQESTIDGILIVDAEDQIVSYNRQFIEMWRIPEDLVESGFGEQALEAVAELLPDQESFARRINQLYENRTEYSREEIDLTDGRTLYRYSAPLFGKDEVYYGRLWLYRDITEQKNNLKEKDFLMREFNHRVKNNLSMITSLISLKEDALGRKVDLSDLARQVDAIRLIHGKLFQSDSVSHINFRTYIEELLATVFSFSPVNIVVDSSLPDILIQSKSAIPLGLLINEIATNSLKHGFSGMEKGRFSVDLERDDTRKMYILEVANNGLPFPEGIDIYNSETLGLQLITALVSQLHGTVELRRKPNPQFTIRFPVS